MVFTQHIMQGREQQEDIFAICPFIYTAFSIMTQCFIRAAACHGQDSCIMRHQLLRSSFPFRTNEHAIADVDAALL